jgi:hypothetical protein
MIEEARSDALELPRVGHDQGNLDVVSPAWVRREACDTNDLVGIEADRNKRFMPIMTDI